MKWSDLGIYDYVMAGILFGYQRICSSSVQSDYITGSALVPWTWARPRLERSLRDHLVMERVILYGQFSVMINDNHNKKNPPTLLDATKCLEGSYGHKCEPYLAFQQAVRLVLLTCRITFWICSIHPARCMLRAVRPPADVVDTQMLSAHRALFTMFFLSIS